jgi:hypothetical protein
MLEAREAPTSQKNVALSPETSHYQFSQFWYFPNISINSSPISIKLKDLETRTPYTSNTVHNLTKYTLSIAVKYIWKNIIFQNVVFRRRNHHSIQLHVLNRPASLRIYQ